MILLWVIGFSEAYYACLEFYFEITFPHAANQVGFLKIKAKAGFSRLKKAVPPGRGLRGCGVRGCWRGNPQGGSSALCLCRSRPMAGLAAVLRGGVAGWPRVALGCERGRSPTCTHPPMVGGVGGILAQKTAHTDRDSPFYPSPPKRLRRGFARCPSLPQAARAPARGHRVRRNEGFLWRGGERRRGRSRQPLNPAPSVSPSPKQTAPGKQLHSTREQPAGSETLPGGILPDCHIPALCSPVCRMSAQNAELGSPGRGAPSRGPERAGREPRVRWGRIGSGCLG